MGDLFNDDFALVVASSASKAPNKKGRREILIHSRDHMRAGYAGGELKEAIGTSNVYEKPVDA